MTSAQFRSALDRLGVSQSEFARRLGMSDRTMRKYAAADAAVPSSVAILLRLLVSGKIALDDL